MIVEERIYTCYPGKVPEYLRLYREEGHDIQRPILGNLVGWYTSTDIGELNLVVHLWGYEDLADRAARRGQLLADPRWRQFVQKIQPLILRQENRILTPAPWSPGVPA